MTLRIGVLVPPGNPTVEPEFYRMAPAGVTIHFARLGGGDTPGIAGAADGMVERTRAYLDTLSGVARTLAEVMPAVVVLGQTATSYVVGFGEDATLADRLAALTGAKAVTAAGAVFAGLRELGVRRLALATPYPASISDLGKAYWEAAGFTLVAHHRLDDVISIYEETEARAAQLARAADVPAADAVLISGTGLPTIGVLDELERDLRKPVITSNQAAMWRALRVAGVHEPIAGFGRLLRT
jgi:maleate cis-trans isomerase